MKETKEMLGFILSLGNALGQSLDDKKLDMSDALNFWEPLSKTPEDSIELKIEKGIKAGIALLELVVVFC